MLFFFLSSLPACTQPPTTLEPPLSDGGLGGTPWKKTSPNLKLKQGHWRLTSKRQPNSSWDLRLVEDPFSQRLYVRCFRFVFWLQSKDKKRTEKIVFTNPNLSLLTLPALGNKLEWNYQRCSECDTCRKCVDDRKENCQETTACKACNDLSSCLSCLQCKKSIDDEYCDKTSQCKTCNQEHPNAAKQLCRQGKAFQLKLSLQFVSTTTIKGTISIEDNALQATLVLDELQGTYQTRQPDDPAGVAYCKSCSSDTTTCPALNEKFEEKTPSDGGTEPVKE